MPTTSPATIDTITELLSHLIRFPTLSANHATNAAVMDWVQEQLHHLPITFQRHEHLGVPSLTATTPAVRDPKKPKLWLYAHTDVVPGSAHDFEPRVQDGKLIGRGAYDMKYGLAVFMQLFLDLGADLAKYDLGLMLVGDEEPGGAGGAEYLANHGYSSEVMLMPECGLPWNMEAGAKTLSWWKLTSRGEAAHGAYPWRGVNPYNQLIDYLGELQTHFPTEPCGDPDHRHHTMTIGGISGETFYNRSPGEAIGQLDLRTLPELPFGEIKAWFADATLKFPGVTAECVQSADGFHNRSGQATALFEQTVRDVTGHDVTHKLAHASSDARFFGPLGMQVICVPPNGGGQHGSGEWIDLADLGRYYEVTKRFVEAFAAPQ